MEKRLYELYERFEENSSKTYYMFLKQGNTVREIFCFNPKKLRKYVLINNYRPVTLIDGELIPNKYFKTEKYYNMVYECKISKQCSNIEYTDDMNLALKQIDFGIEKAKRETEEYFKIINSQLT